MSYYQFQNVCYSDFNSLVIAAKDYYGWFSSSYYRHPYSTQYTYWTTNLSTQNQVILYFNRLDLIKLQNVGEYFVVQLSPCTVPNDVYSYSGGALIFSFFFIFVLSLHLVTRSAGLIIKIVRSF